MSEVGQLRNGEVFAGYYRVERLLKAGGMGAVYITGVRCADGVRRTSDTHVASKRRLGHDFGERALRSSADAGPPEPGCASARAYKTPAGDLKIEPFMPTAS